MKGFAGDFHFLQDIAGLGGPNECFGRLVHLPDVRLDRLDQLRHAFEYTTPEAFAGQVAEPSLHHVEPLSHEPLVGVKWM